MMRRAGISLVLALAAVVIAPGSTFAAGDPADFGLTLDGPASSSVGGTATYTVVLSNAGPGTEAAKMRLTRGHGATTVEQGDPLRTTSSTTSQGTCFPDKKGVICRVGEIKPGDTVRIVVGIKVFDSDIPNLAIQATVQPDLETTIDPNGDNDHAEVVTSVRAPIAVDGIPDGCASKPFSVKVAVDVPKADQTKAIVDGKTIDTSSKSSFKFKVDPKKLDHGNHSLTIVVQPKQGPPVATLKRKFKTC
jgi:Domain of unknown function DUF11